MELRRFGTDYGGFYYPKNLKNYLNSESVIYCVGAGEDISHDIELANELNSKIYIFDPTPRAIAHVNEVIDVFNNKKEAKNNKNLGGGDINYWNILLNNKINTNNIIFKNYGLGCEDGTFKFYKPSNKDYVSCSLVSGMKGEDYFNVEVKNLNTIMKELNHNRLDLLKIDIEGLECDVINKMLDDNIFPKLLSIDFDLAANGEKIKDEKKCLETINRLISNNYKLLHQFSTDFSFIHLA